MAVTIKDVAKQAHTSIATVSKVLNGSYSISQETADRIQKAIQELDYRPNLRARNFSKQMTKTVVWVTSLEKNISFLNPHMFEIMCGLEKALFLKDYSLIIKSISVQDAVGYIKEAYYAKIADGFVIHASVISPELDEMIEKEGIPHLVVGMPDFLNHFCWVDVDNRFAGELAAKFLLEQGYQTLAFLGGTQEDKISMHRLSGVMSVLKEHDLIVPKNHVQHGESEYENAYRMTEQVLESDEKPQAIICANNYIAYGCISALHDRNIEVPETIGIVAFDQHPFSGILKPKLTVVNIDVFDLGVQAGKYILQKIRKPNLHIQSYITCPEIIVRESTK